MPELFPAWMMSPVVMYGVPALLIVIFLFLLITRRWGMLGLMVLLLLAAGTGVSGYMKHIFGGFQWPMPPPAVVAQTVAMTDFSDRIEALGTAQANESTALTANVTETVKSITITEGSFVTAGTVIATLHDDEERAAASEAQKAYDRSAELVRTKAISAARRDQDKARLDIALAQLADRQIVAPFDGILGLRSISVGDIVHPGTVITTVDDVDPIKLEFSVPEQYLASLKAGLVISARSDAYPGDTFNGVITAIDPRIDPVTRSIKAKAEIPNPEGKLRAGMLMGLDVLKNERRGLAVSEEALVFQGEQKSVKVLGAPDKDNVSAVETRPVTVGARRPGYVEILSGLKEGEKVIVDGVIKTQMADKVRITGEKPIEGTIERAVDAAAPDKRQDIAP